MNECGGLHPLSYMYVHPIALPQFILLGIPQMRNQHNNFAYSNKTHIKGTMLFTEQVVSCLR